MAHTILRCQAIIVLISLQLCLITSLEANLHSEKEPDFTEGIYNPAATFRNGNITKRSKRNTSDSFSFVLCCTFYSFLVKCLSHTVYISNCFPFTLYDYTMQKIAATLNSFQWYVSKCSQDAHCIIAACTSLSTSNRQ